MKCEVCAIYGACFCSFMRAFVLLVCAVVPTEALSLTLKYFDARGAAEVTRVLLALGDLPFTDARYEIQRKEGGGFSTPGFAADKEGGSLAANLGRAPVLIIDGRPVGQSRTMERFVATQAGLMGKSAAEAAIIDSVTEHVRDVKDAQRSKGFSMFTRDKSEEEKATAKAEWFEVDLPSWLQRIEQSIESLESIICGETPTYAAVCIWALLREGPAEELGLTAKAASGCPTLNKVADAVANHPKVAAWVANRPVTAF